MSCVNKAFGGYRHDEFEKTALESDMWLKNAKKFYVLFELRINIIQIIDY